MTKMTKKNNKKYEAKREVVDEPAENIAARLQEEVNLEKSRIENAIPDVIDSPEAAKEAASVIGDMDIASLKAELKNQILEELKDDQVKRMALEKERRERETQEQQSYISKMKESPDPWVDIVGWVRNTDGVNVELEWNNAFVDYLRAEGITGTDDNALVQKWVAFLMRDMAEQMDDSTEEPSQFGG